MKYILNENGSASLVQSNKKKKKEEAPAMVAVNNQPKVNPVKTMIDNSAIKNNGFTISNAITDAANYYDAVNNMYNQMPVIGTLNKARNKALKTIENTATNMGTGALKAVEGAADTASDLIFNPIEQRYNYAYDFLTKGKKTADENLADLKKMQQRDIQKNMTQDILDKTGYSDIVDDLEKDSLVKRDNIGGQVAQGLGGMAPALVLGQAFGATPELTNLKGLAGKERLAAALSNVGKTYAAQLPSNLMLGAQSYGGGMEEALNDGAKMNQARLYGLANAAIEQGTEMLTGGVPGLEGKGGIDQLVDPLIDKTGKGYLNALLKAGYGAAGEGLEEYASEMLNPLAKKIYSNEKIDWDETRKRARQAGLVGAATGAILNTPSNIQNFNDARANNKINNQTTTVDNIKNQVYNNGVESEEGVLNGTRREQIAGRDETGFNQQDDREQSSNDSRRSGEGDGGVRVLKEATDYNKIKQNLDDLKATHKRGAFFDTYTPEELKTFKTFQTDDGKSSISVKPDGDITALVSEGKKGMGTDLLMKARENGGTKMDCYGKFLKELYEAHGYKAVARVKYGRGYNTQMDNYIDNAIKEGKAKSDSDFDIYFMMKNTDDVDTVKKNIGKYENTDIEKLPYLDYDDAYKYRDDLLAQQEGTSNSSFSNDNIAAKKGNDVLTLKNKKGQELKLKQDKNNPNVYEKEQPKTYGESIVPKETIDKQMAKLKDGTKISNFYSNIAENSKFLTQENMSKLSQEDIWRYAPQTNKETMQKAVEKIGDTQRTLENAYADFLSKTDNFTPEDVAEGWIYLKRFQDAGNYEAMVQVAKKMRNIATKSGRTVQMFNIQSRLTPEGMVKYAQSELMEAEQIYNKGKSKKQIEKVAKNFELTGDEVEFIKNQMEKIQGMEDGRAKDIEMAKINKMLSDKLPHQKGDSIKGWMRLSMLFNPKTQVRNIAGNALITPINALADIPGALVDKAISKKTGVRTLGAPSLDSAKTYAQGFKRGGIEAWQDYKMGIDTKDVDMSRFDINQGKPFVDNHEGLASVLNPISKGLNWTNDLLDLAMSGGDRVFYQGAFDSSLRNQMTLNNVDTPTQDMIDIARQEALSRTWNDSNGYTQFVLNTRRALNKINAFGYGLGDVLIPFAKTPANLTKAIVDYSPVGMADAIFKTKGIKNAIETGQITPQMQHDFAQKLGKGVAGTMLYALGYGLAKSGITSGSKDDDKDVANFIQNTMGIQPYSVKIGDKSFTYDWAQPIAAPIAITADAYKNLTRKSDENFMKRVMNTMLDVANTGINVLLQQSFLQGISEVLNNNEGVANGITEQVMGLPARAIPTFAQQINNMFDRTQRVSYENNQPINTAWNQVLSKTPFSKTLAPKVDTLGNEVKRYGGDKNDITYFLKNFLSPTNQSNKQPSKAADEIYDVYENTGDKTIMPMVAPYYIQNKTVGRIDLNSKDRAEYQKISGKLVNDAVEELIDNREYKNLSYDQKAEILNGIVTYANAKAKQHFTGYMANTYNSADKKIDSGMSIADYYLEKTKKKR